MAEDRQDRKLLEEEIIGGLPAVTYGNKGAPIQCFLVFVKPVIIVAFLDKITQIFGAIRTPPYGAMKRWLDAREHDPASSILNKYKSWIIPFADIVDFQTSERGMIRKTSNLRIRTRDHEYRFGFVTSQKSLDADLILLLNKVGIRLDKFGFNSEKGASM
jgi:hypothetical protein